MSYQFFSNADTAPVLLVRLKMFDSAIDKKSPAALMLDVVLTATWFLLVE